jgi:hypothetical protein
MRRVADGFEDGLGFHRGGLFWWWAVAEADRDDELYAQSGPELAGVDDPAGLLAVHCLAPGRVRHSGIGLTARRWPGERLGLGIPVESHFVSPFQEHETGVVAWVSCALAVGDAEQADIHQKPRPRGEGACPQIPAFHIY